MKGKFKFSITGLCGALVVWFIAFFFALIPINIRATEFWATLILSAIIYTVLNVAALSIKEANGKYKRVIESKQYIVPTIFTVTLIVVYIILQISGAPMFHAKAYSQLLVVQDADFTEDLSQTKGTDSIALMDTESAQMLGNREIGSLSSVVSQFDVSGNYTQIDYQGSPIKVSALDYVGFFKWINNNENGVPGYVTVDPVSMSASYTEVENGMVYVPSAYIFEDAARHIRLSYPTVMFGNLHFEIDEEGNPYYVASVYKKTISLFGGETVSGCIILDPVTGDMNKYDLEDVPQWVDMVYDGNLICEQYNWYGKLSNGFWNSLIGKKGCKQVTTYYTNDSNGDETATADYGYVSKGGDIWIYTGITSVNSDSSNIGFLLANERTGESHYFSINGADEKSAMAAAEGEVQEKGYDASFPSLINVDGEPTYIMVLKDASGLVKLYAAVNVEQYNLVTTASSQKECLAKYKTLLGIENGAINPSEADADSTTDDSNASSGEDSSSNDSTADEEDESEWETQETTITVEEVKYIDVDGNTFIYLLTADRKIYKAKVSKHEDMLFIEEGDTIKINYSGEMVVSYEVVTNTALRTD